MTRHAVAREVALNAPGLPFEIWLQVMQLLAKGLDFADLYTCARLNHALANLALPQLYSVHEFANLDGSVVLWRSLIGSALGKTLYPYCTWIKVLKLSNLLSLLEDMGQQKTGLRASFFSPPLQSLKALKRDDIVIEVADLITKRVETAAEEADKAVQLAALEGPHFPSARLSTFVSRLSRLTSLAVRDGSVLNGDVGQAIRKTCPAFKELICFYCQGTDSDTELASFLRSLPPNTLEGFTVTSFNSIGKDAFQALTGHSDSLKRLGLMSIEPLAWESIDLLGTPNLESLVLEPSATARNLDRSIAEKVLLWLKQCIFLKELEITSFPHTGAVLDGLLESPDIHLTSLILRRWEPGPKQFYRNLGLQTGLRHLAMPSVEDDIEDDDLVLSEAHMCFSTALMQLHNLRRLVTNEPFTLDEFTRIVESNLLLEELVLNGYSGSEEAVPFLNLLKRLSHLKSVQIISETAFSVATIQEFLSTIDDPGFTDHGGFQFYLAQQEHASRFSDRQEEELDNEIRKRFGGRFFVSYQADPDDLHESDFSD
ncbi:hypothetical protein B0T14DRAFT_428525 [Immersiella caudata]|uniref:Uncharacterized protein n=1 Tax=Immersiella caudata TaxID=314043 RepID=A0AA39WY32_9PEZI|nr:hypothetical protein B0T14DRAFT_428525 [Immersiella caudata]